MPDADPSHGWHGDDLDLDAYLERVGFTGERAPTLETLRGLQRAHVTSVPFETLEIILGRPIPLDLPSLQDKLVRRRRGGYCYEHTPLFAAVLERIGYGVTGLQARVSMGADKLRPATHALLRVTLPGDDRVWLCDVGFGSGPLEPIELVDGNEVDFDGWRLRLERGAGYSGEEVWTLHQREPDGWIDRHHFTLEPKYLVDYVVGNHYVSTSTRSPFTARPYAQKFTAEALHQLDDLTLTVTRPDAREVREVRRADVPALLAETFGIVLDEADAAKLAAE
ncbi:arylamine N-acetyltransferase family protein [Actinomadura kijaniata]|uniref:arylamine N-acetyltransferase family protein n=1 Tax=Actinomadura kijaniata TaxID=46161 RepID=UPI0008357873|nr:arylamine N-acetyltransferase [Actinomadura kijaniata]